MKLITQFNNSAVRKIGIINFQADKFVKDIQTVTKIMDLDYEVVTQEWNEEIPNVFDFRVLDNQYRLLGAFANVHEAIEYFEVLKRIVDISGYFIGKNSTGDIVWDSDDIYGSYPD